MTLTNSKYPHNTYNAAGIKLRKTAGSTVTDYLGSFIYKDNELDYILTDYGKINVEISGNDTILTRQYNLTDHLGNVRVTFSESGEILQEDSYYPFGMTMNGLSYTSLNKSYEKNQYLYNGKELQEDFGLDWYDYGARFYDAQLGRFVCLDPIAEKFNWVSPYNYAENSPIANIDLWGLQKIFFQKALKNNKNFIQAYSANKQSSLGKQFSKVLKNQTKYNVVYAENNERGVSGRIMVISNLSDFKESKIYYNLSLTTSEFNQASENNKKPFIIITSDQTAEFKSDGSLDNKKMVIKRASTLNHEEGAHGINILQGKEKSSDYNAEHIKYYGKNCDACTDEHSPNDEDVMKDPKYKNSEAYKNLKEIEDAVKNMDIGQ